MKKMRPYIIIAITSALVLSSTTFAVIGNGNTPNVDVEKYVWDDSSSQWLEKLPAPVPIGTDLVFRIVIRNTGGIDLHDITVTDVMSEQFEYADAASHPPVSWTAREVVWFFEILEVGESITIEYHAMTVAECYGSNTVTVITLEGVCDGDTVNVKVSPFESSTDDNENLVTPQIPGELDNLQNRRRVDF